MHNKHTAAEQLLLLASLHW